MNIPQSTIEPFNTNSIPFLRDIELKEVDRLLRILSRGINNINDLKSYFNDESVIRHVTMSLSSYGAVDVECSPVDSTCKGYFNTSKRRRVFNIAFKTKYSTERIQTKFVIKPKTEWI